MGGRRTWTAIGLATGIAALAAPGAGAAVDSTVAAGPEGTAHFAQSPHLAVDDGGKATVAWHVDDPAEDSTQSDVFMRTVTAGGAMSPSIVQVDG